MRLFVYGLLVIVVLFCLVMAWQMVQQGT
jgi:hypothetical protein